MDGVAQGSKPQSGNCCSSAAYSSLPIWLLVWAASLNLIVIINVRSLQGNLHI